MPTREFLWTDAGAPSLTGAAGSLLSILKACIVGSGGTAYGSGSSAKSAAGWQLEYEDIPGKKAVFRNSLAAGGTGCYLWVDDSHATQTSFRAYSNMSDTSNIATGSDPVPPLSPASVAGGAWVLKSSSAGATVRQWGVWADARTIYLNVRQGGGNNTGDTIAWFGDFDSTAPADAFAFGCAARCFGDNRGDLNNSASGIVCATKQWNSLVGSIFASGFGGGLWLASEGGSLQGAAFATPSNDASISASSNSMVLGCNKALPAAIGGNEYWGSYYIISGGGIRGTLRGAYIPLNDISTSGLGEKRFFPIGAPSGSVIAIARGQAVLGTSSPLYGGIGIEAALDW